MFPSDSSFNELHLIERQITLGGLMVQLKDIAEDVNLDLQDQLVNIIIELISIDECLAYFRNYERVANGNLNRARLENASNRLDLKNLQDQITHLQKALNNEADRL